MLRLRFGGDSDFRDPFGNRKSVAFAFIQLFEIEDIPIERDRFFHVIDFDRDVITTVNLDAHR